MFTLRKGTYGLNINVPRLFTKVFRGGLEGDARFRGKEKTKKWKECIKNRWTISIIYI